MILARLLVLLAVLIGTCAFYASATNQTPHADLAGTYLCKGKNPDASVYRGLVEIARRDRTLLVRWTFPQTGTTAAGIGLVRGDLLAANGPLPARTAACFRDADQRPGRCGRRGMIVAAADEGRLPPATQGLMPLRSPALELALAAEAPA